MMKMIMVQTMMKISYARSMKRKWFVWKSKIESWLMRKSNEVNEKGV